MKIAAITIVRNDRYFLQKWIAHYGAAIGLENLFVICRGADWDCPPLPDQVSRIVVSGVPHRRRQRDDWAAQYASDFAEFLLKSYDAVIRADSDEFLVVDPAQGIGLVEAIEQSRELGCVSALGTDVIHHLENEPPLDPNASSVLAQRRYGVVTREFSKPVVIFHPVRWGPGFHRADWQELRFANNLHLFHLALHDRDIAEARLAERATAPNDRSMMVHVESRLTRFEEVTLATPIPGDEVYQSARDQIAAPQRKRGIRTRPGHITEGHNVERGFLIEIPSRFSEVL